MKNFNLYKMSLAILMAATLNVSCDDTENYIDMSSTGCRPTIKHVKFYGTMQEIQFSGDDAIGIYALNGEDKQYNICAENPTWCACPDDLYPAWGTQKVHPQHFPGLQNDLVYFTYKSMKIYGNERNTRFFAYYPYDSTKTLEDSIVKREMILNSRPKWVDPSSGITFYRGEVYETADRTLHVFFWF